MIQEAPTTEEICAAFKQLREILNVPEGESVVKIAQMRMMELHEKRSLLEDWGEQ